MLPYMSQPGICEGLILHTQWQCLLLRLALYSLEFSIDSAVGQYIFISTVYFILLSLSVAVNLFIFTSLKSDSGVRRQH